jgi:2-dehydro-3-deoxyphosphooctonate aldolase (KDO 8-P synthase)
MNNVIKIGRLEISADGPFFLIAGPCVIENEKTTLEIAHFLKETGEDLHIPIIFKTSYDKANRTSLSSFRGPGKKKGLEIIQKVKKETGLPVNIKKGQFLSPWDMEHPIQKVTSVGNHDIFLTERGTSFGYNNLVVDIRSIAIMKNFGFPVVFDATHSVQLPGGQGARSGGQREFVGLLSRAAVAAGADGVFMEVHPEPDAALCDGPNSIPLRELRPLLVMLKGIHEFIKS